MSVIRTYNPSVRVGNWNEDIQLEEDTLKEFLEKKENGQLLIQQTHNLAATLLCQKQLSISRDGFVHFGDVVMLCCNEAADRTQYFAGVVPRHSSCLVLNLIDHGQLSKTIGQNCSVSGSKNLTPCLRSVFVIKSVDGTPDSHPLQYGQAFHLSTLDEAGNLLLQTDQVTFQTAAKKSRHQKVQLISEASYLTQWQIKCRDPRLRLEFEGAPVPANEEIIFTHCKTNKNLSLEQEHFIRTPMGREYEISCHNYLDSHKAEKDVNRWMIKMVVPGNDICPVTTETADLPQTVTNPPVASPPTSQSSENN